MAESMKGLVRTARCGEVTEDMIGKQVTLMGWVAKSRNKGGIVFVDLRDRTGIMQVIFEGNEKAATLHSEYCIAVTGAVRRGEGAADASIRTGTMEIAGDSRRIIRE